MSTTTLVFLHGVGLDHSMWDAVTAELPRDVRVVAPDLPGHGSREAAGDDITLADLANGVLEHIDAGSHLVGFSLGALVAQYVAIHFPDRVASLTSVSSVCRRTDQERAAVLSRLRSAEADFHASVEASLQRWYHETEVDAAHIQQTETVLLSNDPRSFVNCYRVFATADAEIADGLAGITAPALAITGERDPGSTPEMSRRLAAAIPNGQAIVVPGARHMLPVQRPRELAQYLSAFIGRLHV